MEFYESIFSFGAFENPTAHYEWQLRWANPISCVHLALPTSAERGVFRFRRYSLN